MTVSITDPTLFSLMTLSELINRSLTLATVLIWTGAKAGVYLFVWKEYKNKQIVQE